MKREDRGVPPRDARVRELNKMRVSALQGLWLLNNPNVIYPPNAWAHLSKDELISGILEKEFPPDVPASPVTWDMVKVAKELTATFYDATATRDQFMRKAESLYRLTGRKLYIDGSIHEIRNAAEGLIRSYIDRSDPLDTGNSGTLH